MFFPIVMKHLFIPFELLMFFDFSQAEADSATTAGNDLEACFHTTQPPSSRTVKPNQKRL